MEQLTIRRATGEDLPALMDFYTAMIDEMAGTDFDILWKHDEHPSHAFIRESAETGAALIGLTPQGNIASALVVNHDAAPGYEKAAWRVPGPPECVGVMHAVATLPVYHGRGFARQMVQEAIRCAREDGLAAIHLDTFVTNDRAHGLYGSCGFTLVGTYPIFYDDLGTVDLDMFEYVIEDAEE